ncbi:MAG TPA: hypothetical protein VMV20_04920, partial [Chitinophagaceae bacterium]|nr:hypothetical protein [Chitinophagaceae bacterium]
MQKRFFVLLVSLLIAGSGICQSPLDLDLGNLYRLSDSRTRSIGPENPTGQKGMGGMATLDNGTAR